MYEVARDEEKKNKLIQGIVEKKDNKSLIKNYEICFSCFCSNFEISSLTFSYCSNSSSEKLLPCWESLILF
jgi:hypothetical protein